MRYDMELCQLYKLPVITEAIKVARLLWEGHIYRMSYAETPRRIKECKPERRSAGHHKLRRMDGVAEDLRKLGIRSWWRVARDRE
jgi:hypothetical protein